MRLSSVLDVQAIRHVADPVDKWRLIDELACALARRTGLASDALAQAMTARERELATGLERGLAIPHALVACDAPTAAVLAVSPQGLDFDALDGAPVHLVLALTVPEGAEGRARHLALLSAAAALLTRADVRTRLLATPDAAAAYDLLVRLESGVECPSAVPREL